MWIMEEEPVVQVCVTGDIGESKFGLPLASDTRFCYVIGPRVNSNPFGYVEYPCGYQIS